MLAGTQLGEKSFNVHLDGYNLMPFLGGEAEASPRKEFIYRNDDGQLVAIRYEDWKSVFYEQNNEGIGVRAGELTSAAASSAPGSTASRRGS